MSTAGAIKALAASLGAVDGRQCIYRRGSQSVPITAVAGRTEFEAVSNLQVIEHVQTRDFIVTADQLVLDGRPILPQAGDRIDEVSKAGIFSYVVAPPADGIKPWRYCDTTRTVFRVHTKEDAIP